MIKHEEYKEMAAVSALGALDPAEAHEFETHLATCEECRAELVSWQDVAAEFAYAAPTVEPPTELRSRILESIRVEGAPQTPDLAVTGPNRKATRVPVEEPRPASNVAPFARPLRRPTGTIPRIFAIAAAVAFVALIISLLLLWNRYNTMQHEMARLSDRFAQAQAEIERESALKDLISAPDAQIARLAGTEMAAEARAKLVLDRKTGRAMLMTDGLPPAPEGKAYQLWFIADGRPPMPGHVFTPDARGHTETRAEVPAEARNATAFAVTLESRSGATSPTGPKYLLSAS